MMAGFDPEFLERVGHFLAQYVDAKSGHAKDLRLPEVQRSALRLLLRERVMTADALRREALRDYDVIIPWDYLFS